MNGEASDEIAGVFTPAAQPGRHCEWDGCRLLTTRQKRFGSARCRALWWNRERPRLTPSFERSGTILELLLGLMSDCRPRTVQEIADSIHALPCSVSARLRDAKRRGHIIVRDRSLGDSHYQHTYRLVIP